MFSSFFYNTLEGAVSFAENVTNTEYQQYGPSVFSPTPTVNSNFGKSTRLDKLGQCACVIQYQATGYMGVYILRDSGTSFSVVQSYPVSFIPFACGISGNAKYITVGGQDNAEVIYNADGCLSGSWAFLQSLTDADQGLAEYIPMDDEGEIILLQDAQDTDDGVRVYQRTGAAPGTYSQYGPITFPKDYNTSQNELFGWSMTLSADGSTFYAAAQSITPAVNALWAFENNGTMFVETAGPITFGSDHDGIVVSRTSDDGTYVLLSLPTGTEQYRCALYQKVSNTLVPTPNFIEPTDLGFVDYVCYASGDLKVIAACDPNANTNKGACLFYRVDAVTTSPTNLPTSSPTLAPFNTLVEFGVIEDSGLSHRIDQNGTTNKLFEFINTISNPNVAELVNSTHIQVNKTGDYVISGLHSCIYSRSDADVSGFGIFLIKKYLMDFHVNGQAEKRIVYREYENQSFLGYGQDVVFGIHLTAGDIVSFHQIVDIEKEASNTQYLTCALMASFDVSSRSSNMNYLILDGEASSNGLVSLNEVQSSTDDVYLVGNDIVFSESQWYQISGFISFDSISSNQTVYWIGHNDTDTMSVNEELVPQINSTYSWKSVMYGYAGENITIHTFIDVDDNSTRNVQLFIRALALPNVDEYIIYSVSPNGGYDVSAGGVTNAYSVVETRGIESLGTNDFFFVFQGNASIYEVTYQINIPIDTGVISTIFAANLGSSATFQPIPLVNYIHRRNQDSSALVTHVKASMTYRIFFPATSAFYIQHNGFLRDAANTLTGEGTSVVATVTKLT